jgi:hypothetical protein
MALGKREWQTQGTFGVLTAELPQTAGRASRATRKLAHPGRIESAPADWPGRSLGLPGRHLALPLERARSALTRYQASHGCERFALKKMAQIQP